MHPTALFGEGINAYSPAVSRQRRLNCFYEIRKDGDKYASILRGTPGAALFATLPTFPVRGWRVVNNVLYVVAGSVLYSVTTTGDGDEPGDAHGFELACGVPGQRRAVDDGRRHLCVVLHARHRLLLPIGAEQRGEFRQADCGRQPSRGRDDDCVPRRADHRQQAEHAAVLRQRFVRLHLMDEREQSSHLRHEGKLLGPIDGRGRPERRDRAVGRAVHRILAGRGRFSESRSNVSMVRHRRGAWPRCSLARC
jgi:hypothetical protein